MGPASSEKGASLWTALATYSLAVMHCGLAKAGHGGEAYFLTLKLIFLHNMYHHSMFCFGLIFHFVVLGGKKILTIFVFDFSLIFVSYRMKPLKVTRQQKCKQMENGV